MTRIIHLCSKFLQHDEGVWTLQYMAFLFHFQTTVFSIVYCAPKSNYAASSEFSNYRLCEQRRFRTACASVQSRQNLRCLLIQAVSQEEPSDRKPDPWPLRMAGHAQLKFVMKECSKTHIRLTGLNYVLKCHPFKLTVNRIFIWIKKSF